MQPTTSTTLGVIGAGAMGGAILDGVLRAGLLDPAAITVVDRSETARLQWSERGCFIEHDPAAVRQVDILLLAVKPQQFPDVAGGLSELSADQLAISVMAGVTGERIQSRLGGAVRIVRAMPNTPSRLGVGMAAIAPGPAAAEEDLVLVERMFTTLGRVVRVHEDQMDAVTAVSGSGPAYIFLLAEAMTEGGVEVGLDEAIARTLAYQTILGAGTLLAEEHADATTLRRAVTSPNGTTEAALRAMTDRGLPEAVRAGIIAARDRGRELAAE